MRGLCKGLVVVGVLCFLSAGVYAQDFLESAAARRISQETGIPQTLIRAMFVEENDAQFILAFIYINEQTLAGRLKPEIQAAITPFVQRNALLVLVVPARSSFFDPFAISFVQNIFRIALEPQMVTPITPDFAAGVLPSDVVSAGIIALDSRVLAEQPFQIQYAGGYSATFSLNPESSAPTVGNSGGGILGGGLRFLLLNLLFLFLFPFLLV